jgi:glycosyltransferase involved in cell wall biosynthesis
MADVPPTVSGAADRLLSVSVLIDNFNYGRYLKQSIDSLFRQTYSKIEVVVVDDGSTDESRSIISAYGSRIKAILKDNGGQSSALNAGFAVSTGDIICLLDSDDWFLPNKVERIFHEFRSRSEVGWVFDPVEMMFQDGSTTKRPPRTTDEYVDVRSLAPIGKTGPPAPPSSGLSFRRNLLGQLLPMSEEIRIGSDNFLKFAAMTLSPGLMLGAALTMQRIHDSNAGTMRNDRLLQKARQHLLTARELRTNVPLASRLADKVFCQATADYLRSCQRDEVCDATIRHYFCLCRTKDIFDIVPRTIYQVFRRVGSTG